MVKTKIIMQNTGNKNAVTAWTDKMNGKMDDQITNYVSYVGRLFLQ
jgi:hypothetical protein